MKRGRPSVRGEVRSGLLKILTSSEVPLTVSSLTSHISKDTGKKLSWNTVQKYLQELVESNKVQPISFSHSKIKGKEGLTVYILKKIVFCKDGKTKNC